MQQRWEYDGRNGDGRRRWLSFWVLFDGEKRVGIGTIHEMKSLAAALAAARKKGTTT